LFFLRHRIDQHELRTECEGGLKIHQSAVRADYDRLSVFSELAALDVPPCRADRDSRKDSGTAPWAAIRCLWHVHGVSCNVSRRESIA
jgi:hypothetical protein